MKEIENNIQTDNWNKFIGDGNMDALSRIYFHYYDLLFTYGLKHHADKQIVEDSIQNVFMNLIKSRKSIGEVRNLSGYLVSSFRRQLFLAINRKKKTIISGHLREESFDFFKSQGLDGSDNEQQEMFQNTIQQCVKNLTSKQQEILFLRFENEMSYEDISAILHISVDSCYKSVYRSIRKIRSEAERMLIKGQNMVLWFWSGVGKKKKTSTNFTN